MEPSMSRSPGASEEAWSGRTREATGTPGVDPAGAPEGPPPSVDPPDPVSSLSHEAGGTYAKGDFSPAARRSEARQDQLERQPGPEAEDARRSTFAEAKGREGPSSVGGGQ
jgi:hypothetical protein